MAALIDHEGAVLNLDLVRSEIVDHVGPVDCRRHAALVQRTALAIRHNLLDFHFVRHIAVLTQAALEQARTSV